METTEYVRSHQVVPVKDRPTVSIYWYVPSYVVLRYYYVRYLVPYITNGNKQIVINTV